MGNATFKDKVVVITGASSGIGEELAVAGDRPVQRAADALQHGGVAARPLTDKVDVGRGEDRLKCFHIAPDQPLGIGPGQRRQVPRAVAKEFAELAAVGLAALNGQRAPGRRHVGQLLFMPVLHGPQVEEDA